MNITDGRTWERQFHPYGGSAPDERKEEIIEDCIRWSFEFIDPASQQEQPRKINCIEDLEALS